MTTRELGGYRSTMIGSTAKLHDSATRDCAASALCRSSGFRRKSPAHARDRELRILEDDLHVAPSLAKLPRSGNQDLLKYDVRGLAAQAQIRPGNVDCRSGLPTRPRFAGSYRERRLRPQRAQLRRRGEQGYWLGQRPQEAGWPVKPFYLSRPLLAALERELKVPEAQHRTVRKPGCSTVGSDTAAVERYGQRG
jgi:hypothetical protein